MHASVYVCVHALQALLTACLAIKRKRAERACRVVKVLGIDMVDRDAHGLALVHSDALAVLGVARVPCSADAAEHHIQLGKGDVA